MQACRHRILTAAASLLLFASLGTMGSAEDMFSTIGSISSPDMPTVTSPTMGSGFYMPGNSSNPIYTGSSSNQTQTQTTETSSDKTNSSSSLESLMSTLTASDIYNLDQLGLLNQVTSLYSSDTTSLSGLNSISNLYTSSNSSQTNILLQKVLSELEELKLQNNQESKKSSATPSSESSTTQGTTPTSVSISAANTSQSSTQKELKDVNKNRNNPKILRFSVNGYDILSTCRTIYISQIQANGSFLVTGDRKYLSDGKTRSETFHILFKPNEASNGISSYSTATGVTQDYQNVYSFLYQLSQLDGLNAQRTGNLVSLRTSDPSWKLELLLDLGE